MNLGFLISMYDEIDTVKQTVSILKQNKCKIILIQSDPGDSSKILDNLQIDYYKKLSDVAGSKEEYLEERNLNNLEGSTTPVKAITRNLSIGFSASQNLTVDWWIVILGDILISNLSGIKKIIN